MRSQTQIIDTQLPIEKALEFVGDNCRYQKKRLGIIAITVLSLAILTNRVALEDTSVILLFLIASGAGQIVCPIYMSLRTCTLGVGASALFAIGAYPMGTFLRSVAFLCMGFFSRGFFVSSLIYINEIGGDRFRAWSTLVIYGLWAISTLFNSIDEKLGLSRWIGYYLFVFLPCLVSVYFVLQYWQPSPLYLYFKRQFIEAKAVLSQMAFENDRPDLPYNLEGQNDSPEKQIYRRPTYLDLINRPLLRRITVPLCILWIYRQYVYYSSCLIIPQLGHDYSKTYILVSISQTVAVFLSYSVRLHIKRVNAMFAGVLLVLLMSLISSFTTVPVECFEKGQSCFSKHLYIASIMMIRFATSLLAVILVSYTLEIYPSNVRRLGFSVCLGVSSMGSIVMPWLNESFISLDLSGFISFAVASLAVIYFVPLLDETYGRMRTQTLEQLQCSPENSLKNWALLNFE